jgi:hypothetical protein
MPIPTYADEQKEKGGAIWKIAGESTGESFGEGYMVHWYDYLEISREVVRDERERWPEIN